MGNLPHTYGNDADCETLEITVEDKVAQLEIILSYTAFKEHAVLVRSAKVMNKSQGSVSIEKIMSLSLDFPTSDYDLVHLNGTWAREAQITRESILPGIKVLDSKRGASSHQQNPFFAIVDPYATEQQGEVFGFSLVYSGNFAAQIQMDAYNQLRLNLGINPFQFSWKGFFFAHFFTKTKFQRN